MAKSMAQKINGLLKANNKTKADLARAIGVSNQTVTLWCKELDAGGSEPKNDKLPAIAEFFNTYALALLALDDVGEIQEESDKIEVSRLDTGVGLALAHETFIKTIFVSAAGLKRELPGSDPSLIRFTTAFDDSMSPTFNDGDVLLVDTGVKDVSADAVYVFTINDQLYIKRLQRRPDGSTMMISDNRQYDPYVIAGGEKEGFRIIGRAKLAWISKRI